MMERKKKQKKDEPKGFAGTVYTLAHDLLYVLAGIVVIFVFFMRLTGVNGPSMRNTLIGVEEGTGREGDYLALVSNVLCSEYRQGDIVVACIPSFENGKPIVKRVIATEGQTVDIRREGEILVVYVDGEKLDEPYLPEPMTLETFPLESYPLTVPANCYFLMGDNRNHSNDSRNLGQIGFVDRQYIVGKAVAVVFPGGDGGRDWSRLGFLH